MDLSVLLSSLINTAVTFFLDLVVDGLFGFLSDLLFGGAPAGLI